MNNKTYGYIRVSTVGQNDIRQRIEIEKHVECKANIFTDKVSGKDFNRPNYQKLRKKLREGDLLVLKSLDRLGRNYEDIQSEWRYIAKDVKADIIVLDMPILDTRTNKDLVGTLISDIILQLLSYVAETERAFIHQRQTEGIAAAKAMGKKLGRPSSPYPHGFDEVYNLFADNKITKSEGARMLGITFHSFRWYTLRKNAEIENTLPMTS